jgi:hypothetical protein
MKKIWKNLIHPPKILLFIVYFITICLVILSILLLNIDFSDLISNIVYVFTAIAFGYSIYTLIHFSKQIKQAIIQFLNKYTFTRKFINDYGFRITISTNISFAINASYAIFEGVMAIIGKSIWYASLSAYHSILGFMRYSAIKKDRKIFKSYHSNIDEIEKWKTYRNIGIEFLIITPALGVSIGQMILSNKYHVYAGLLIYVVSTYTFYKIIIAICNIIKVQKYCQPIWQSLKNINLADAAVSILSLQVALIATFSSDSKMLTMNIVTGSVVSLGVIAIGLFMIVNSTKKIKLLKKQEEMNSK